MKEKPISTLHHDGETTMKVACRIVLLELLFGAGLAVFAGTPVQSGAGSEEVWREFMTWFEASPPDANPARGYLLKLQREGVSAPDIERRAVIIKSLFFNRPEAVEIYYDRAYAREITGNPALDVPTYPSAFLISAVKDLKPGAALDVGMGQGRNAVFLAQRGWKVTGFDISRRAIEAAESNAAKAGVSITTARASYENFDYGNEKWDLIVLTFAWAPVADPAFVARLRAALRANGRIVFEHFTEGAESPRSDDSRSRKAGQLRSLFSAFAVEFYDETEGTGDWGGPQSHLVRTVVRKP
jgi:2-polyprenyl-3-methyl-5-hydroxy-6-metoxy-1,4-benzoquinol methylase